jgi:hypothetical protein
MIARTRLLTVVSCALAVTLAGCTSAESPPSGSEASASAPSASDASASAPAPDGLTASLLQYRRDVPRRFVEIKFANDSRDDFDIALVEATLPGYETSPRPARSTPLVAGRRVDLPVRLGSALCDSPLSGQGSAAVDVVSNSGSTARVSVPVADDDGLLERLHEHDCAVQRVEEAVDLQLSDTWERTGSGADAAVRGQVTATLRPGAESAQISDAIAGELLGMKVLDAQGNSALPMDLNADQPRVALDLDVIGTRCDGHAVAESRRLMAFEFSVAVAGEDPVPLRRTPDLDGYRTLVAALLERCGIE